MYGCNTLVFISMGLIAAIAAVIAGNYSFSLIPLAFAAYHLALLLYRRRKHEAIYGKEPDDGVLGTHWSKLTRKMTKKEDGGWK
jgi:hypothetical protein